MSYEITEVADGKIIELILSGKLTAEAYEHFVPVVDAQIERWGKVRMMVVLQDFHGWDAGALWADTKFAVKHFHDLEKLALVGESKWEAGMATFCKPFTKATVKYFDHTDIEDARTWIQGD
ncbi:SpoIIAA family protein [Rhodopirellula halodulae]|uniref:STAS/SEC14 domain-containing protein n=1 Tax=Rhodopirellula halodulae TaxID=2894198 RepID=UPI001E560A1F|nr:STAS/SEC14 domain-containing protein [Rhodopirellula sp. JC737]MCC9657758.1 STAS/SEC14 domain-containing protein [Rhodopirellula sp. JC737]